MIPQLRDDHTFEIHEDHLVTMTTHYPNLNPPDGKERDYIQAILCDVVNLAPDLRFFPIILGNLTSRILSAGMDLAISREITRWQVDYGEVDIGQLEDEKDDEEDEEDEEETNFRDR